MLGTALEDITKNANDLSGLVRRKDQAGGATTTSGTADTSANGNDRKRAFEQSSAGDNEDEVTKREKK